MDEVEKLKMKLQESVITAAVEQALVESGAVAVKPLRSYLRTHVTTRQVGNDIIAEVVTPSGAVSVSTFARNLTADPDFEACFRRPAVAGASGETGPRHVAADDLSRLRIKPEDISAGRVIVDFPEQVRPALKDGEVSAYDPDALNANIESIASGKVKVVQ